MNEIISIISDAAAVMQKLAKELGIDQQLCQTHGIHLAVIDVICKTEEEEEKTNEESGDDQHELDANDSESETEYETESETESENEETEVDEGPEIEITDNDDVPEFVESINDLIVRLRKAVNRINKSPVSVYQLQVEVKKWQKSNDLKIEELVSNVSVFTIH